MPRGHYVRKVREIIVDGDVSYVPLSQGKVAKISTSDIDLVSGFNWNVRTDGPRLYAARSTPRDSEYKQASVVMHRAIMNPENGFVVDHINGDGLDNRRENLRVCTTQENCWNSKKKTTNKSGFKGVSIHVSGKWRATIFVSGKQISLGLYQSPEDAAEAYKKAASEKFGIFANHSYGAEHGVTFNDQRSAA